MEGKAGEKVIPTAPERREPLIQEMQRLAYAGNHCAACTGVCCTFLANSMQITPVEAVDLRDWLIAQGRWDDALKADLQHCVKRFRLDHDVSGGRRSMRKTYTCPFYQPGPKGCSISRHHKPYGCLAFNTRETGVTDGGNCASDQTMLERHTANTSQEHARNLELKTQVGWFTDKAPIPVALLQVD